MSKARANLVSLVHVQQYQKQQGNSTAILTRSCMFGTFDPQGSALLIDRQQHLCVARFCSTTVDPDTSSVDRYSLTTVDNTHLPSTDIFHPTLIDTPFQTSIDTEPREMVAPLILVRDNNGDLHDHEGHLRNTTAKHPHPPSPVNVRIDRHANNNIDRHEEAAIDQQHPVPIDRRAPITYRVHMPKIDVARLNALRPKPKPSEYPPEPVRTPSDDGEDPMEENRVPTGRTLRRRKEKVVKHLKRGANEKEKGKFLKESLQDSYR
ncbi:hypothetical protein F2Q68_00025203 [Brassica cretica]|uniref:Uncharacterized protein n=1 Tax=Brassica cretica TaxID=69181 RepID=A0A8S9I8H8_BRACR|nr:hypothetical protein F2Q68_00025203 [Brassica cretica]